MIASTSDGAFDKFGVRVRYSGVVAVACQDSDAIYVGCSNFMMRLFDGAKSFTSAFDVIGS